MTPLPPTTGPGSTTLIAPPTEDFAARAKAAVMNFYVTQAEKDGVPATQRAMYAVKLQDARTYLAGISPDNPNQAVPAMISGEAQIRTAQYGQTVTPFAVATAIVAQASQFEQLELTRIRVNSEIENAAGDVQAIVKILDQNGITMA